MRPNLTSVTAMKNEGNLRIPESTWILGIRIHRVSMPDALSLLDAMITGRGPHQVVTINPEFVMTALKNKTFRDVLNSASLAVADGIGVVMASRLNGIPLVHRVTGVDLIDGLADIAGRRKLRIFFLGAQQGVAEQAAIKLLNRHPGFTIAGCYAGSPAPADEDNICRRIIASSPDILLVAYGAPNQDLWIARNLHRLNVPVSIGIGGSFDFISGMARRAPRWMQSAGLEWLHRLVKEPRRWRRMLALPRFAFRILWEKLFLTVTA